MVNTDMDAKTKILSHRKIIRKAQKNNNLLKTKRMLKPKYKVGDRFLQLACQGSNSPPLCHPSVTPLGVIYCIYIQ